MVIVIIHNGFCKMRNTTLMSLLMQIEFVTGISPCLANVRPTDFDSLFPTTSDISVVRYPFELSGLSNFGYVSSDGKLVIPCKYERATSFRGGFAAVRRGGLWGLIDHSGAIVLAPRFRYLQPSLEEIFPASEDGKKFGYVNSKGEWIIRPVFDFADSFSEGLGLVRQGSVYHFIDHSGNSAMQGEFQIARSFSDGLAAVRVGEKWGYVDRTGQFVIPPKFVTAEQFSEGLAAVGVNQQTAGSNVAFGFIDAGGRVKIQPKYNRANRFSEGLACVQFADFSWGYVDHEGRNFLRTYRKAGDFSAGLAPMEINGRLSFVDKGGKVRLIPEQHFLGIFCEGVATVSP